MTLILKNPNLEKVCSQSFPSAFNWVKTIQKLTRHGLREENLKWNIRRIDVRAHPYLCTREEVLENFKTTIL
jgi:hypothetical protein